MLDVDKFIDGLHDYISRALSPLVSRLAAIEARPEPRDGIDGKDGAAGASGPQGERGADGKSVTIDEVEAQIESHFAKWALGFEIRASELMQRTIDRLPQPRDGRDGERGADGRDGLGFDDLSVEFDGERSAVLRFVRGDVVKEFPLRLPTTIDRGVHKSDVEYQRGDGVTLGGSWWIAQKDAPAGKPGDPDSGWRLAVKAGRPGKDGDQGPQGVSGAPGINGRNYDGTRAV